jgi:GNAT superfamily N-acetyltransferase
MLSIEGPLLNQAGVSEPILRALPDWFGIEESLVEYVGATDVMPTFVASDEDGAAGFASVNRHNEHSAEIHVIAVRPDRHRRGVGKALMERIESWLSAEGVEYLQVKTLGPSRSDGPYALTREFYQAVGFRPLEEFKTLWGPNLPCLVMVKRLAGR